MGTEYAAKATPDGYTFEIGTNSTHAVNPYLYPNINYHPINSFIAVAQLGVTPLALVVNVNKVPVKTVAEFIAYAKAHPGSLNQSTAGVGSGGHILGTLTAVLRERKQRYGVAGICIGVGQALAVVVENLEAAQ